MRYEFHPEALAEYEAAALYYAERDPAVGQRFVGAVEDAIDRILDAPTRGRALEEDVRRCLTRVFPYVVVFPEVPLELAEEEWRSEAEPADPSDGQTEAAAQRHGVRPVVRNRREPNTADLEERLFMAGLEAHYSARDIEARILAAVRAAGLNPEQRLSPEELGALDHFHTGGLRASRELLELARIRAEDRVLDIGAGLAGPARLLACAVGCRVDCLELSPDFCAGAALLNRLTGLDDRIEVHKGSALDLPFPDDSFDVVWMQNVGMNIADKRKLYGEICRVLKPGGRYAFQEMAAGEAATSYFPLPWATDPADSFLVSGEEIRSLLGESGFTAELFEDTSDAHLSRTTADAAPSPLTLGVYVDNLAQKAGNARRSLQEGQIRLVRGVFRVK